MSLELQILTAATSWRTPVELAHTLGRPEPSVRRACLAMARQGTLMASGQEYRVRLPWELPLPRSHKVRV